MKGYGREGKRVKGRGEGIRPKEIGERERKNVGNKNGDALEGEKTVKG